MPAPAQPPHAIRHRSDAMRPETQCVVPDLGKPRRATGPRRAVSTRPGRSTRHGSDGMCRERHRAMPGPGKAAGAYVAQAEPSACRQALDRQRPNGISSGACPSVRIRRITRARSTQPCRRRRAVSMPPSANASAWATSIGEARRWPMPFKTRALGTRQRRTGRAPRSACQARAWREHALNQLQNPVGRRGGSPQA